MSSSKPVLVITGGNAGLGYETIKAVIKQTDYDVVLGCRTVSKGEEAVKKLQSEVPNSKSNISVVQIDVASDESIEKAFKEVSTKYSKIDTLINNAGANLETDAQQGKLTTRQAYNQMWDINVTGAHIMSETFMPLLIKSTSPRLVFITSGTSSLIETQETEKMPLARINASPEAGWPKPKGPNPTTGYRSSKAGMNMLVAQWARILKNDGVKVFAVSPGFLATNLNSMSADDLRKIGAIEPHIGGEFVADVATGKQDQRAGHPIRKDADQPW